MRITAIPTAIIRPAETDLQSVLDTHLSSLPERAIVAITSKIVSLCEGRVIPRDPVRKQALIAAEAEYVLPPEESAYGTTLTIRHNLLLPSAGIDESNGDGVFILWPEDPQRSANEIRRYLTQRFDRREIGVIITDSTTRPLRRGVTGVALAHSGFTAVHDYRGQPDLFGRPLAVTQANVRDALATAAVLVMGEGNEQTPLALIEELPFVTFQDRDPASEDLAAAAIALEDDLYAPLLIRAPWQRGGKAPPLTQPQLMVVTTVPDLRLIELTPDDAQAYYALVDRNRAHLTQHGDYLDLGEATPEAVAEDLTDPENRNIRFGVWLGDALIGRVDLNPRTEEDVVLGYWLGGEYTGKGYATAACQALIAYGQEALGAKTMWAGVTKGNRKSEAVLQRLGFQAVSDQGTYTRFTKPLT